MNYLITNANIVNEGKVFNGFVRIKDGMIDRVAEGKPSTRENSESSFTRIDAGGKYLLPGVIDDQVHFREPGLTHKADIYTESKAAAAGGITSFMEMPNTVPNVLTQELLEQKYRLAAEKSLTNYSFYMGASNDNLDEIVKTDPGNVCGVKVFMGSSTGNMLVDNPDTLRAIFGESPLLVAVHAEDETIIRANTRNYRDKFGDGMPVKYHPEIRSAEACYRSSSLAVELAHKYGTRLHILHLSTARETKLFTNDIPLKEKKITAEVCVHHLWFSDSDYERKGTFIKWNPAVKTAADRDGLWQALLDDRLDVIATDHAPHTLAEKQNGYFAAPSGGPMVQHSLTAMLEFYQKGIISLDTVVRKMCHAPADCFNIDRRGYIRPGYFADLVLVDLKNPWTVEKSNILYKCGWSPMEGQQFNSKVTHTFVNGRLVYHDGTFDESVKGQRLKFIR